MGVPVPATKRKPLATRTTSAKAKTEGDARVIDRVSQALEAAQKDLASIGGSLGTGARDLSKGVQKMLRDAQRDLRKMSKALARDLRGAAEGSDEDPRQQRASRSSCTQTQRRC